MEFAALGAFIAVLLLCVLLGRSTLYALLLGYIIFCTYGLLKKFTLRQLLGMSMSGIKTVRGILLVFMLIGMLTGVWRAGGTIAFIIYYASGLISPPVFILAVFLLCCLVSTLTGTSFGTVATIGVICMTLANAMGVSVSVTGGAILSGIFFGDRCSPMSTSAFLVSRLTGTDIYRNIKNMLKPSAVPFLVSCALYLLLGRNNNAAGISVGMLELFAKAFNLHPAAAIPAVIVVVLCLFKVNVRIAMLVSILAGCLCCLLLQGTEPASLFKILLGGFYSADTRLGGMMDGGGIVSMVNTAAIVCLSSSYAGIFDGTGILNTIKERITRLSKITAYGSVLLTAVITSLISCNQTFAIILTHYLCKDFSEGEQLALDMENTVVVIPALIPWSIACAVPLSAVSAPLSSIFFAFYLYLLPLWRLRRKPLTQ